MLKRNTYMFCLQRRYSSHKYLSRIDICRLVNIRLNYSQVSSPKLTSNNAKTSYSELPHSMFHMPHDMQHTAYTNEKTFKDKQNYDLVSNDEFEQSWKEKFIEASPSTVKLVENMLLKDKVKFTTPQLLILVRCLESYKRENEINSLCRQYLRCYLQKQDDGKDYNNLLVKFLRTASKLEDYALCEELFSIYIKLPSIDSKMIQIGLKAFIENDNLDLAKEFYIQALNNPETFPVSLKELYLYLLELYQYRDFDSMDFAYKLWLQKKCDKDIESKDDPNYKVLSLMHMSYLYSKRKKDLEVFLDDEYTRKNHYLTSIDCRLTELYNKMYNIKMDTSQDLRLLHEDIDTLILYLGDNDVKRRSFYLSMMHILVAKRNFVTMKHIVSRINNDKTITFDAAFLSIVAKYFCKAGSTSNLLDYYNKLVFAISEETGKHVKIALNKKTFLLFRDCLTEKYPFLIREITNEFRLITKDKKIIDEIYWLKTVDQELDRVVKIKSKGGVEYRLSSLNSLDYRRYDRFSSQLTANNFNAAEETLLNITRGGIKPSIELCYLLLKDSLRYRQLKFANILDNYMKESFKKIPIKIDLLWLKKNIQENIRNVSLQDNQNILGKLIRENKVKEFELAHKKHLKFVDYIKLANISINSGDFFNASQMLENANSLIDKENKYFWNLFYMRSIKLATREHDLDKFLITIKHWNDNEHAGYITNGCLRQLKAFVKIFGKRKELIDNYKEESILEIAKEIERLKNRYIQIKFSGLTDIKLMTDFLKKWITQDIELKSQIFTSIKAFNNRKFNAENIKSNKHNKTKTSGKNEL